MTFEPAHENDWILGVWHKNTAECVSILGQLMKVGLQFGQCSASDVQIKPGQAGAVGAVFKVMKKLGFEHTKTKNMNGKDIWILKDRVKAETFMEYQLQYIHTVLHEGIPV